MLKVSDTWRQPAREQGGPPISSARIIAALKAAKLRPTRQRVALGALLLNGGHRHVTADDLQRDAASANISLSLATVYNTLNQFAEAGLIRRVAVAGGRTHFDTDVGDHQHFYVEEEGKIIDVPPGSVRIGALPTPPDGYKISHVDIVIRLVPTANHSRDDTLT